jgi:hypothetical protein
LNRTRIVHRGASFTGLNPGEAGLRAGSVEAVAYAMRPVAAKGRNFAKKDPFNVDLAKNPVRYRLSSLEFTESSGWRRSTVNGKSKDATSLPAVAS